MTARFDAALLRDRTISGRVATWLARHLNPLFALLRLLLPTVRFGRFILVTRRDDVEEVLARPDIFHIRFPARLNSVQPDPWHAAVFPLGTNAVQYRWALATMSRAMPLEDVPLVADIVDRFVAPRMLAACRLDLGRLARLTTADLGYQYFFGEAVEEPLLERLALCCIGVANYQFGPQTAQSAAFLAAQDAAAELSGLVQHAIVAARSKSPGVTLAGRLIAAGMDSPMLEATLTGLLTALIPAGTLAILSATQLLLGRRQALSLASKAARTGDDVALGRCLFEALRFQPILPALFRDCVSGGIIAAETSRCIQVRHGDTIIAAIQSGGLDPRRVAAPRRFDPGRSTADNMVFGFGLHWCIGHAIGRAVLVATLKPVLRRGLSQTWGDRRATRYLGSVPETLLVRLG